MWTWLIAWVLVSVPTSIGVGTYLYRRNNGS